MPVVWSDRCLLHEPEAEIWVGVRTPATEVPARITAIRDTLDARVVDADPHPDEALLQVHDPELPAYLASAWDEWEAAGLPKDPGQSRVVPYVFAHAALGARRDPAAVWARPGHFAYDTMTLVGPGHLGGGTRRRRLRPDRRRPRARGRARCLRVHEAAGPSRHPGLLRRLLLPEQRRRRRRRARRRARGPSGGAGHRRPPRQRHAGDLLRASRRAGRLGARRPGRRLVPALPRLRGRDRRRHEPQSAAATGDGRRALAGGGRRAGRVGEGPRRARRRARRGRRRRRPREPARGERARLPRGRSRCSAASACRRSSSRRAATTSSGSGRSCARPCWGSKRAEPRDRDLARVPAARRRAARVVSARIRSASASPAHPRSGRQRPSWPRRCGSSGSPG